MPTIGTLNENLLHAALKERYARPGDGVEVARDSLCSSSVRMWLRKWLGSRLAATHALYRATVHCQVSP